jgi:hypothetical protein
MSRRAAEELVDRSARQGGTPTDAAQDVVRRARQA